jgi:hypothetical protein
MRASHKRPAFYFNERDTMKNYKAFLVYMTDDDLQVYDVAKGTVSALKKDGSGPSHPEVVIATKESMRRVGHEELQQAFHDFS